jgi:hypothetical protein
VRGGVRVRSGLLAKSPLPTVPATAWLARRRSSLATGLTSLLRFVSLRAHGSLSADSSSSPPGSSPTRRLGYPCHRRTPPRCGAPRLTSHLLPSHPGAALHLCCLLPSLLPPTTASELVITVLLVDGSGCAQ